MLPNKNSKTLSYMGLDYVDMLGGILIERDLAIVTV